MKIRFQNYFFNKFLLENILPSLQSHNLKIFRSNLQYLSTLLTFSKNSKIIINIISYFLLGLNDPINDNTPNNDNADNISNNNNNSNAESNNINHSHSQINENEISEDSLDNNINYTLYHKE